MADQNVRDILPLKVSRYIQIKIDNISFDSLKECVHSVSALHVIFLEIPTQHK